MLSPEQKDPETFTDLLRRIFKNVLGQIASFLNQLGVKPNTITLVGLFGNLAAGVLIALGHLLWGGLLAMVMGPLDALDGVMARLRNESGKFGAFIDSVSDRYSEIFIYGGLIIYFISTKTPINSLLVFFAAVGSVMVSYTRARAEAVGLTAKIGLMTRAERYIVLIPGLLFGYPLIALWILAILTNLTAFQRIWFVFNQIKLEKNK